MSEPKLLNVLKQKTYALFVYVEDKINGPHAIRLVGEWTNFRKMLKETKSLREANPNITWFEV